MASRSLLSSRYLLLCLECPSSHFQHRETTLGPWGGLKWYLYNKIYYEFIYIYEIRRHVGLLESLQIGGGREPLGQSEHRGTFQRFLERHGRQASPCVIPARWGQTADCSPCTRCPSVTWKLPVETLIMGIVGEKTEKYFLHSRKIQIF